MACATALSIFSFAGKESASFPEATPRGASIEGAHAVGAAEQHPTPPGMLLDLEHLTPETLAAFFPSEHALAK